MRKLATFFIDLYRDGFRNMTWGKPLVWIILLKLFILFAILRVFFFKPAMSGLSEKEKSEVVGENLTKTHNNTWTLYYGRESSSR